MCVCVQLTECALAAVIYVLFPWSAECFVVESPVLGHAYGFGETGVLKPLVVPLVPFLKISIGVPIFRFIFISR